MSDSLTDFFKSDEKFNLLFLKFLITNSESPGSKIGTFPFLRELILFKSLSTQITSLPKSAKHTPLTNPT